MINNFKHRYSDSFEDTLNIGQLISEGNLSNEDVLFLRRIKENWNFYEGYHWEGIDDLDTPQVTFNFCRPFVNKFVSFEFGKGFFIKTPIELEETGVTIGDDKIEANLDKNKDGVITDDEKEYTVKRKTLGDFLNQVWEDNNRDYLLTELGQMKSITGEAWLKVQYEDPSDLDDPFEEYPNGRLRVIVTPTQFVFPKFGNHDKDKLESLLIMYPIRKEIETGLLFKRTSLSTVIYKEFWTKDEIVVFEGAEEIDRMANPYGFIPFVQIKNFPVAGRTRGQGDLDDIIPLNVELNTKKSDVSEVIDYHSAPITLVYGAKIGNLEKGANKVWGGLPKDSKVENLNLQGDLLASVNYVNSVKSSMCEIAGIPENVLGGSSAISNTSGVALQYMNLPLIERTRIKKTCSTEGLRRVNKMLLSMALYHGLIEKPEEISMRDFLENTVEIPETLPKDELLELQKIQQEMALGLESRHGAMERLGKENIAQKLAEIDNEKAEQNSFNNGIPQMNTNAGGMMNGENPIETVRKEMTGQNGLPQINI